MMIKSYSSIDVLGFLGIAFITLKVMGCLDWSWWWVTSPFWLPALLLIVIFFVLSADMLVIEAIRSINEYYKYLCTINFKCIIKKLLCKIGIHNFVSASDNKSIDSHMRICVHCWIKRRIN
jgi:hypothetical protein